MLYLVGGASRAGKSWLARRLLERQGVPYFSLDVLMMGLANGWPWAGIDPESSSERRGEQLWPLIRAMAVNLLEEEATHPTYLIEGDTLLPYHVAELRAAYPARVRACFIGYAGIEPPEKLRRARLHEPDWCAHYSEAEALAFLADMVRFSRYLEHECAAHGIAYFDCTTALEPALAAAHRYLMARP